MNLKICGFLVCAVLASGVFSKSFPVSLSHVSLGVSSSLDYWEGEDLFVWEKKERYPTPSKTLNGAKLALSLRIKKQMRVGVQVPFFWNIIHDYQVASSTNYVLETRDARGVGDIALSLSPGGSKWNPRWELFIPGLYSPRTDLAVDTDSSSGNVELSPWTGMGVYRLGFGLSGRAPFAYVFGKMELVLGDFDGEGLVETLDSKLEAGGLWALSVTPAITLKPGVKLTHGRYHWYGKGEDPRIDIFLNPFASVNIKFPAKQNLSVFGSFTGVHWVNDDRLPIPGKKLSGAIAWQKYF